jgi:carbonic anhydrase
MRILIATLLSLSFLACNQANHAKPEHDHKDHWSYEGESAPENWAKLSEEFIKCAEGHFQSPIDIQTYGAEAHPEISIDFQYHPSIIDEVNNGHTIQANLEEENAIIVSDKRYALKQFHFHEPSEHQIDGIIYPMEMHLVHADSAGKLAVVGVFIKEGEENRFLSEIWQEFPEEIKEHHKVAQPCDLTHLLPNDKAVFHYTGSLTTPPCTEGVNWYVMEYPISLSKAQIDKFRSLYHGNNRPIQDQASQIIEFSKN